MTLEALNTVFSGLTFVVIAVTAAAASVQLRHLRASNQLTALITILEDWQKPELQRWVRFVRNELPQRVRDPAYLDSIGTHSADRDLHPWLHVCDYYEQIGSYLRYGLMDKTSFLSVGCTTVSSLYAIVEPCVERMRAARGSNSLFENFEYVAVLGKRWEREHPDGTWPRGLQRFKDLV